MAGDALISPQITVRLLRQLPPPTPSHPHPGPGPDALTHRERDIARLVARGFTNQEIATGLVISPGTAKTHLANIQARLKLRNRVEIAAWAWQTGLTPPAS